MCTVAVVYSLMVSSQNTVSKLTIQVNVVLVYPLQWASRVAQLVKNSTAMQGTWVQSLGWEDPLEKGKATHSRVLAWRILWTV